jgi:hypothetical protein
VLSADSHFAEYARAATPLRFPAERFWGEHRAIDGGVYWDPDLPHDGLTSAVSQQYVRSTAETGKYTTRRQYPLVYIRLGPAAVKGTDTALQSVMWHEFQHYRQYMRLREPDAEKSAETKLLETEFQLTPSGAADKPASAEVEAASIEIAAYLHMADSELQGALSYLGRHLADALPIFRDAGIQRIVPAVSGDRRKQARLLRLMDTLPNPARRTALKPLRDAVAKAK